MKQLIVVNGTMGAGKSAVCEELLRRLTRECIWTEIGVGRMNPFTVIGESGDGVGQHLPSAAVLFAKFGLSVCHLLLGTPSEEICQELAGRLEGIPYQLHRFTLTVGGAGADRAALPDVEQGIRTADVIRSAVSNGSRSMNRIPTCHIAVDGISAAAGCGADRERCSTAGRGTDDALLESLARLHKKSARVVQNCYVYRGDSRFDRDSSQVIRNQQFDLPLHRRREGGYQIPSWQRGFLPAAPRIFFCRRPIPGALRPGDSSVPAGSAFYIFTKRIDRFYSNCLTIGKMAMSMWPSDARWRIGSG
jgi:hypothetical protein